MDKNPRFSQKSLQESQRILVTLNKILPLHPMHKGIQYRHSQRFDLILFGISRARHSMQLHILQRKSPFCLQISLFAFFCQSTTVQ